MKKLLSSSIAAAILAAAAPAAQAEVSASVGFYTDYVFRGQSQTDNEPAIQGGLDWSHESGFYVGAWGSNVDFGSVSMELDLYGGYGGEITDALSYDVGAIYYRYPDGDNLGNNTDPKADADYWEVQGNLSYDFGPAAVTVGVNYSPDFFAETDDAWWYYANLDVPLPMDFGLALHIGHQDIDDSQAFGAQDWNEWSVGVNKSWVGLDFGLTYTDTDLSDNDCFGGSSVCDAKLVFSVGKSF